MDNNKERTIVFINQTVNDLFVDIVNEFDKSFFKSVLITGYRDISCVRNLNSTVKINNIIAYNRSNILKRLFTWLYGTIQIIVKLKFSYQDSDLFIVSNPPTTFWIPLFCKNRYSLLVYDVYPDVLNKSGVLKETSWFYRWWVKKNHNVYLNAKNIYTIGEGMAKCVSQYIEYSKIVVIPNWADTDFLKPIEKKDNSFIIRHNLQDKFVVMYSGNMGNTHKIESLIEIADTLKDEQDMTFVIIGEGAKKNVIEKMVINKKLSNCLLLPFQSVDELPYSLNAADIGVITLDIEASSLSVPSKTYSMMAVGAALLCIAGKESELGALVDKFHIGAVFEPESIGEMASFILLLKKDKERLAQYKMNSRSASLNFTPKNAKKYVDVYKVD